MCPHPARADIAVDAALCASQSSGTVQLTQSTLVWADSTAVTWHANVSPYCSGLAPTFYLVSPGGPEVPVGASGSLAALQVPMSGSVLLRMKMTAGSPADIASAPVTVNLPDESPLPDAQKNVAITSNDAAQRRLFVRAIGTPGATVRVAADVNLDLSGREQLRIERGVQLFGDPAGAGPRLFTTSFPGILFVLGNANNPSDNVRISGLRIDGGQGEESAVSAPDADGILIESSVNVEVDHNEIYGWRGAAVSVTDDSGRIDLNNAGTVWVHDNYLHHNQNMTGDVFGGGHGGGYGVAVHYGAYALIEKNVFDYNRHSVEGDGRPGTGYLFYRNLILEHGGWNTQTYHTHQIDMHGFGGDCAAYQCGAGGEYMDVEYNTILYTKGTAIHLRGTPAIRMTVSHNVFKHSDVWTDSVFTDAALHQNGTGLVESDNQYGVGHYTDRLYCDFDGDGRADAFIATGATWWYNSSARGGRWVYLNQSSKLVGELKLADVDGDGLCDITDNDGVVTKALVQPKVVSGDFNGDHRTDLALIPQPGMVPWTGLPVALSNGDGTFNVMKPQATAESPGADPMSYFAYWARFPGVRALTGDFNGDGKTDIALIAGTQNTWTSLPVAFSHGDGTFRVTNAFVGDFAQWWSAFPGATAVTGDFDHDGKTDIALVSGLQNTWTSLPVAFSNGDGTFRITNYFIGDFAQWWSGYGGAKIVTGDFNNDGRTDIVLVSGLQNTWTSLPVAFSNGDGTFRVTNYFVGDFAQWWSGYAGAEVVTGDFNADKKTDILLTGGAGWLTVPIASSNGNGTFSVSNAWSIDFSALSAPSWPSESRYPKPGVPIPNVMGMTTDAAVAALARAGYGARLMKYPDVACSYQQEVVTSQEPPYGVVLLARGSDTQAVELHVPTKPLVCAH
jgi:hypothetical protein